MTTFGKALRTFREMTRDPDRHNRPLSQVRLGVLMGHIMDDRGFSGAAVSNWERGGNKISEDDRKVLVALIKVLYEYGGIETPEDSNQLLEAGNYRTLDKEEAHEVFGEIPVEASVEQPVPEQEISKSFTSFLVEKLLSLWDIELRSLLDNAKKGPPPSWPRVLALFMRKSSERISFSPKTVLWIGICWIAWWLVAPSLRWPFADRDAAATAIGMYAAATLILPLLIGLMVDTKNNEYWKQEGLMNSRLLRLYTYQGAGIGFNLGYFFVFPVVLIKYFLGLDSSVWAELAAAILGVILGNMSA